MKQRTFRYGLAALLLGLLSTNAFADSAQALTVDELIAKNIEAKGGIEKVKAIQSLKMDGRMQFSGAGFSVELGYAQLQKRGGKYRNEASLQGLTAVTAYDSKDAWQIQPFQGRKDPEKLAADQAKGLAQQADIDGPLIDWKAKGHKVEYLGTEDVDGTPAHKLKVSLADGDTQYIWLDPDHFLEIRMLTQNKVRGVEFEQETDVGNYERVAGVYVPFSYESGTKGQPKGQKITIDKAEANVAMDDALFAFPSAK